MALPTASDNQFPKVVMEEVANDGSATVTPAADHRAVFLGEDGFLHAKDSSGTVTDPYDTSGGSAPDDAKYVVSESNASLSAEVVRPELGAFGAAGTPIDFTAPSLDTGVTDGAITGFQRRVIFPANGSTFADVASSIGTGDFDVRTRLTHVGVSAASGTAALVWVLFYLADSSRTGSTKLAVLTYGHGPAALSSAYYVRAQVGSTESGAVVRPIRFPVWLRMVRVSGTVTYYASFTEEATWITLHSAASALNIAKIGFIGVSNAASNTLEVLVAELKSV